MKPVMIFSLIFIFCIVSIFFAVAIGRTEALSLSPDQKLFIAGTIPAELPNGLYKGSVGTHKVSWQGKKFNTNGTGINLFDNGKGGTYERYIFHYSVSKGLRDPNTSVIAIDYNLPSNPFWLRPVRDEIVEIAPNHFLGKLNYRLGSGVTFTAVFFELQK